tara:strand:+ start:981 stop:1934 length:954 start_codon:yes stop_codon:yes gene_type:complete
MAKLLYRPVAEEGESMYGYIHRVAYYNGFNQLSQFVSHITQKQVSNIRPAHVIFSNEILKALIATGLPNSQLLEIPTELYSPQRPLNHPLRVCAKCIRTKHTIKINWLFKAIPFCFEHSLVLSELKNIQFNKTKVINWDSLVDLCTNQSSTERASILENIAEQRTKNPQICLSPYLDSYFKWRYKQLKTFAKLTLNQSCRLPHFYRLSNKERFNTFIDVLMEQGTVSEPLAKQLIYWGIVEPYCQIERLGLTNNLHATVRECVNYCQSQFTKDFPLVINDKICSGIEDSVILDREEPFSYSQTERHFEFLIKSKEPI